jgi:hypothetical protein
MEPPSAAGRPAGTASYASRAAGGQSRNGISGPGLIASFISRSPREDHGAVTFLVRFDSKQVSARSAPVVPPAEPPAPPREHRLTRLLSTQYFTSDAIAEAL